MYTISVNATYYTPHQEIQKYVTWGRMNAISGNVLYVWRTIYAPHQAIQYIVRHIKKYKKYATLWNTVCCTPHQKLQEVCHIRKYRMRVIAENALYVWRTTYTQHQEIQYIVGHTREYKRYATSGYTWCTLYQEMPSKSEEQYMRHIRRYNILYATSGNTKSTPHQVIQDARHIGKFYVYLRNYIYAISRNAMYVWRTIYTPHRKIQYIVRHIRKYKMYVT